MSNRTTWYNEARKFSPTPEASVGFIDYTELKTRVSIHDAIQNTPNASGRSFAVGSEASDSVTTCIDDRQTS